MQKRGRKKKNVELEQPVVLETEVVENEVEQVLEIEVVENEKELVLETEVVENEKELVLETEVVENKTEQIEITDVVEHPVEEVKVELVERIIEPPIEIVEITNDKETLIEITTPIEFVEVNFKFEKPKSIKRCMANGTSIPTNKLVSVVGGVRIPHPSTERTPVKRIHTWNFGISVQLDY